MKRMMKLWTLVAVAAMGFVACQNNFEESATNSPSNSVVVKFISEEARTSVDTSGDAPVFSWSESDTFEVLEQTDALAKATSVNYTMADGKAYIDAEFAANAGKVAYKYIAIHPASGFVSAESIDAVTLALPAEQTMAEESYDANADLMVSLPVTTNAQPTEAQPLRFTRVAAVAKLTINNLNLAADEVVESVEFTANGKTLAGSITANLENPVEDTFAFSVKDGVSTVKVATTSKSDVYFTVLPTTLEAGDAYSVVILTNKHLYIKTGSIPAEKSLVFESGMVTRIGVNMAGIEPSEKWVLVRDASTLKEGDVVTIVSNKYDYVVGANVTSNYPYASKTTITKIGDYFIHPTPANATKENMVQPFTLVKRDANRNAFDFYNGTDDYSGDANSGFLCIASSKQLKLLPYYSLDTQFDITIKDGIASIIATNGTTSNKTMIYNLPSSGTPYFCCYSSTDDSKAICLYRLEGVKGEIPVISANVAVPTKSVVVPEEGAATATAIDNVAFNYVGDWEISAIANVDWITFEFDKAKNQLTYTAVANDKEAREAKATITASMEGQESQTWTFNILQKGKPMEISIAEFLTKEVNENVAYKLTGILTEIPSSSSNSAAFKISDKEDNIATIKYLYTDGGDLVKGNVDLKLGDVITVTTVVTSTKGVGGSSSKPSYYKGYYRLTASADTSRVGYEGATANITLATEGDLKPEDAVIEGVPAKTYDFVTFNHTDNATTATATFAANAGAPRNAAFNFTYGLAQASVTIGQENNPDVKVGWYMVEDVNDLQIGDKVIIAGKNPDGTLDYSIKTWTNTSTSTSMPINVVGNYIPDATGIQQFTLANGAADYPGTFAFVRSDGRYLCNSSGSLKTGTSIDKYSSWSVDIDSTKNGAATLGVYKSSTSSYNIMMNWTTSNQTFNLYTPGTTGKGAIYIYKYYNE